MWAIIDGVKEKPMISSPMLSSMETCTSRPHKRKYDVVDEDDRILELPEPILHQILSLLPTRDATKTCVLSKTWNSAWNSFPVLDFNRLSFRNNYDNAEAFYNYVNNSIARRSQNLNIQTFKLAVCINNQSQMDDVERWLSYAVSNNVEHLNIVYLTCLDSWGWLKILPTSALFRAKSLTELDLYGWKLSTKSGMDHNIGFFSLLKKLKLVNVYVDEQILQSILSNSGSLEEVSLEYCYGFRSVNLCSTKHVTVSLRPGKFQIEKITIEAQNLRFLRLVGESADNVLCNSKVNKDLKELVLDEVEINDAFFRVIREFRELEKLKLRNCLLPESIPISSYRLSDSVMISDTTIWLNDMELVADCFWCRKNGGILKKGLYKVGVN